MNLATKNAYIDGIINRESPKYTDVKGDRGGPTKFGITIETLSKWRKEKATAKDVENLGEDEARAIYAQEYITGPGFEMINDQGIAGLLIDWGVMSGPEDAIKGLQTVLSHNGAPVKVDGVLGSRTAQAANGFSLGNAMLRNLLVDDKILFHVNDVVSNPTQLKFLNGWIQRSLKFRAV